jgi:excinuclease ABC subunit B
VRKKVTDILEMIRSATASDVRPAARGRGRGRSRANAKASDRLDLPRDELARLIQSLTDDMQDASRDLRFEEAARLRDEIHELKRELREVG